ERGLGLAFDRLLALVERALALVFATLQVRESALTRRERLPPLLEVAPLDGAQLRPVFVRVRETIADVVDGLFLVVEGALHLLELLLALALLGLLGLEGVERLEEGPGGLQRRRVADDVGVAAPPEPEERSGELPAHVVELVHGAIRAPELLPPR